MLTETLFFVHYTLTLVFGIVLSFAFCNIRPSAKNFCTVFSLFVVCGALQLISFIFFGEFITRQLYPLMVHVPLGVVLVVFFKKSIATTITAISTTYLCCQPSKWFGLIAQAFILQEEILYLVRILVLLVVYLIVFRYLTRSLSEIFGKDTRSVLIFSCVPLIYYLYDYAVNIYFDLWAKNALIVMEGLAFFLCIAFLLFCIIYYKEYEKKLDAERKEQLILITVQQQAKEIAAIKKSNLETNLLRHDMRLLLGNLALSIEHGDKENALRMISGFAAQVDAATVHRFCENDIINYILTNAESRCSESKISFHAVVEIGTLSVNEILFSSILSNALDNAMNAQEELPEEARQITLMLKESDGKLLLSVRNSFHEEPEFLDGLPVTKQKENGHGYGTQSIRYMTERIGGKCQFIVENDQFVLRVVL